MRVRFNAGELRSLRDLAWARTTGKEFDLSSPWSKACPPKVERMYLGLLGERALSLILGCDVDRRIYLRSDDGRSDVVTPSGFRCDVKTRRQPGWDYALRTIDAATELKATAVLAYTLSDPREVEVRGWLWRGDALRRGVIKDYGYGDRFVIDPGHFNQDLRELIVYARGRDYAWENRTWIEREVFTQTADPPLRKSTQG